MDRTNRPISAGEKPRYSSSERPSRMISESGVMCGTREVYVGLRVGLSVSSNVWGEDDWVKLENGREDGVMWTKVEGRDVPFSDISLGREAFERTDEFPEDCFPACSTCPSEVYPYDLIWVISSQG